MPPKTVLEKIIDVCGDIDKPSRQAIKKALAEKHQYTNEAAMKKALLQGVKSRKLIQKGQSFYAPGSEPSEYEPEPEKWIPLPPDEKHAPGDGMNGMNSNISDGFPEQYRGINKNSENRSFWKFAFHLQELVFMYKEAEDDSRAGTFQEALDNMLDLSNHNYEHYNKDKHGNYIGIGHEDVGTDMVKNDVKCLRDIYGVGASTVTLIEEWIETGTMKRLEDLRKDSTPSITERVRYMLNGDDIVPRLKVYNPDTRRTTGQFDDYKHKIDDYNPDFLEALGELADLYEGLEDGDHRATSFRRAITALEGQIITGVEDIKLFKLAELKGVGKATLEMYNEFIVTGKIKRLEEERRLDAMVDYMPGFYKTLEAAGYHRLDMYGLTLPSDGYIHKIVFNLNDLDKVKDKVKPEILEMFKEYIETKKVKKLAKTLCKAFIESHEPLRTYLLKKPFTIEFNHDDPEWNYSGKTQKLDIMITSGFQEYVLQEHDFEDILEANEYDVDQLRNKVQEIQKRVDNHECVDFTLHEFEGSMTECRTDGVLFQHAFKFCRWIDDSDTKLESLGWTPPGLENFLNNELMGGRGDWHDWVDSDDE